MVVERCVSSVFSAVRATKTGKQQVSGHTTLYVTLLKGHLNHLSCTHF